ncbi:MAG TPA: 4-hydroxy-tetrahydrodipicolinate synthase [Anaerolineae bacterium]|nr:4-hydroxy-tetrahydrodipicolinate synthase [Anaerolineae bacterium]
MVKKWHGVFGVLCTPFAEDEQVDEQVLRRHIRFLLDEGRVHGIIPTGSTGEFVLLSEEERKKVVDITIDEVKGSVPVVVGAAAASTRDTIMHAQYAQEVGADGVMVVSPYYCHPSQEELYEHYRTLAQNIDIPIMLYNNPATSGVDILPPLAERLAKIDNVSYIKESTGDMGRVAEIMRRCGDRMTVLCGCDTLALEMFAMGVRGWVAAPANVVPGLCVELYELAVVQGDLAKARELYFKLLPLFDMFESTGQYVQLVKAGLEMLGRPAGVPRRPLLPASKHARARLWAILESLGL